MKTICVNLCSSVVKNMIKYTKPIAEANHFIVLDKFDTLTHSISEGLPREIALRQKQYAYYRDLLLNFPNLKQEAAT